MNAFENCGVQFSITHTYIFIDVFSITKSWPENSVTNCLLDIWLPFMSLLAATENANSSILTLNSMGSNGYIQSSSQEQEATHIAEKFCLTSSLIPDSDCNSTSNAGIYFSHITCLQFMQYCLYYCKDARTMESRFTIYYAKQISFIIYKISYIKYKLSNI